MFYRSVISSSRKIKISTIARNESSYKQAEKRFMDKLDTMSNSEIVGDFKDLVGEMKKRRYNMQYVGIVGSTVIAFLVFGGYNLIKKFTTKEVSGFSIDVIDGVLQDPEFEKKCLEFIQRPTIINKVTGVLKTSVNDLCDSPEVRTELANLLYRCIVMDVVKAGGSELGGFVANDLVNGPNHEETRKKIYEYLSNQIRDVTADPQIKAHVSQFMWGTLVSMISRSSNSSVPPN
jgi:hypothetical protein